MFVHGAQPTPCPDVNAALSEFLSAVRAILGEHFVGLYLHGSLACGDFNPARSDIDFVVVIKGELTGEKLSELEAMHARLAANGPKWAAKLESAYIPQNALRRYDSAHARCPWYKQLGGYSILW
jgi:predicted nucleotidyltransferase